MTGKDSSKLVRISGEALKILERERLRIARKRGRASYSDAILSIIPSETERVRRAIDRFNEFVDGVVPLLENDGDRVLEIFRPVFVNVVKGKYNGKEVCDLLIQIIEILGKRKKMEKERIEDFVEKMRSYDPDYSLSK